MLRYYSTSTTTRFRGYDRSSFFYWLKLQTRWSDNDVYGHVNNVQYLSFFDTTVNHFLYHKALSKGDFTKTEAVGLCVHSSCDYFRPVSYPEELDIGLFVSKMSNSSVRYELGVFQSGSSECAAHGVFVHVYVGATTRRPVSLPLEVKIAVQDILKHV